MRTSVKIAGGFAALALFGSFLPDDEPLPSIAEAGTARAAKATADLPGGLAVSGPEAGPAVGASGGTSDGPAPMPAPSSPSTTPPPARSQPARGTPAAGGAALLQAAGGGDGDSWKDTAGREYRLGLVNTPEFNECYGSTATAKRKELTAGGFRADVYTVDRYGRSVSVVTTTDGRNLNVYLARNGFADDRYLDRFRAENPSLATELDSAFAAAKAERAGLWGACTDPSAFSGAAAPAPARSAARAPAAPAAPVAPAAAPAADSDCHPDYLTCIPVKGTGSGSGEANDLDCGDIGKAVTLRQVGVDPYRLDGNNDGAGCESYA
ncbi:MAG: thermonuclease family protein [Mycobacteriales bacterium]